MAELESIAGKNSFGNTVAATDPYSVKSNHSSAVPSVAALTALFAMECELGCSETSFMRVSCLKKSLYRARVNRLF
jgi:hypothetical protein